MNKLIYRSLAFACIALALSCNKEPDQDGGKMTRKDFTAAAPVTKAALDGNSYIWEPGDVIFVCSNARDAVISGSMKGASKIVLDASNISEDGRTANFSADVPESATMYYAYSVGKDENLIRSVSKAGVASFAAVDQCDAEIKCAAFAACLAANKKLSFSPVLSPVNFQVSNAFKVVLEGKNGETVTDDFTVDANGKATLCGTSAKKSVTAVVKDARNAYFYLAPGISLKGYKLTVYKDNTTVDYEVTSDADLVVETGVQIRLGEISQGGSKDLYADWMAGTPIDFYKRSFSKADGIEAVMVSAGMANTNGEYVLPSSAGNVAYFVDPEVTLVADLVEADGTVLIIGNNSDKKSNVRVEDAFYTKSLNLVLGVKNVNYVSNAAQTTISPVIREEGRTKVSFYMDHCNLELPYDSYVIMTSGTNVLESFTMSNTYWKIKPMTTAERQRRDPASHEALDIANIPANQGLIRIGASVEAMGDLRFYNNVFYCADGFNEIVLTEETTAYEERLYTLHSVELLNNTFINLSGYVSQNNKAVIGGGAGIHKLLDIANNIIYNDYDFANSWMFIYRTNNSMSLVLDADGHVRIGDEGGLEPIIGEDGEETGETRFTYNFLENNYFYLGEDAVRTSPDRHSLLAAWAIVPGMSEKEAEKSQHCWVYSGEDNPFSFLNKKNGTYEVRKGFSGIGANIK